MAVSDMTEIAHPTYDNTDDPVLCGHVVQASSGSIDYFEGVVIEISQRPIWGLDRNVVTLAEQGGLCADFHASEASFVKADTSERHGGED